MGGIPADVRSRANGDDIVITVRIGHGGVTDSVVSELIDQLSKRNLVKIKANRGVAVGSAERSELFEMLATATDSTLVLQRGNVAVFWSGVG
jgi:RNA-binding protein YhbY